MGLQLRPGTQEGEFVMDRGKVENIEMIERGGERKRGKYRERKVTEHHCNQSKRGHIIYVTLPDIKIPTL